MWQRVRRRCRRALTTAPAAGSWIFSLMVLVALAAVAVPFAIATELLRFEVTVEPWPRLVMFGAVAVLVPCLAEELVFRVTLLPHPSENPKLAAQLGAGAMSTGLFILWHPVNAALLLPGAWPVFTDWRFLLLAGLLGVCCAAVYLRSGSVWPGVTLHWLVVMFWKAWLGGPLHLLGGRTG